MPYTIQYGSPYQAPGAGAALAQGAQAETDFARTMKNNEMRLKDRRLEVREGQLQLQRAQFEFKQDQAQRQHELKQQREQRRKRAQEIENELRKTREERLQQKLEWRMDQAGLDRASEERRQARAEMEQLRAQGAVPANSGLEPPPNSYVHEDMTGQKWHVPRLDPEQQMAREQATRKERNKLRKWGAQPLDDPNATVEDAFVYTDSRGETWRVPEGSREYLNEDMREETIDVLESNRKSLQRELDRVSKDLMNYQERKRNITSDIKEKERLIEKMDESNPRYKREKNKLEALRTEKKQIETNIRQMPDPADHRKRIDNLRQRMEKLATGKDTGKAPGPSGTGSENNETSGYSSAEVSETPTADTRAGTSAQEGDNESPMDRYAREKQLFVHPQAPEEIKNKTSGEILELVRQKNPDASMEKIAGLAIKLNFLSPGGAVVLDQDNKKRKNQ